MRANSKWRRDRQYASLGVDAAPVRLARKGIGVGIAELVATPGFHIADAACLQRRGDKLRLLEPPGCTVDADGGAIGPRGRVQLIYASIRRSDGISPDGPMPGCSRGEAQEHGSSAERMDRPWH